MKKTLLLMLLICFSVAILAACGNKAPAAPVDTTTAGQDVQTPEKEEFVPEIIPASNVNPRKVVIDYMYKMANLEWTPSTDIDLTESIAKDLYYKKGTKYHGIIYITGDRTHTDYDEFSAQLNEKGEYIGPITQKQGWGNHCSSAIRVSYDQVSNNMQFGWTGAMVPSQKKGTLPVGDYIFDETDTTTDSIIEKNTKDKIIECYTLLQPGDAILTCWGPTGHARMVVSVDIKTNPAGKINPNTSTITTIEQTNAFDKTTHANGKNTTWYVEHVYTFNKLWEAKYIPLTIAELNETPQDTTFTTKSTNTAKDITSGTLRGLVNSSYCDIDSVTVEFVDANGNVVANETYQNTNYQNLKQFFFSNAKAPEAVKTLSAGEYTYYVTANTPYGSAKVFALEFTVE